jgi:hypothetical protein
MGQTMPQGLDPTRPFGKGGFALMPHGSRHRAAGIIYSKTISRLVDRYECAKDPAFDLFLVFISLFFRSVLIPFLAHPTGFDARILGGVGLTSDS